MTFAAESEYRGGIIVANFMLLSVIPYASTYVCAASTAPDVKRKFKSKVTESVSRIRWSRHKVERTRNNIPND